ncbi:MAG: NAD-dependent epimerase/dehydratase family protein, partial [Shewanella vesiculosa]|nr:NAD-dependent epimerase/dehydratase family protein [Shewanella vesiculosa]
MGNQQSTLETMDRVKGKVQPDFWKGKKVFVTGHTGFKGSWLSLWLQSMGATVKGYALTPPSQPNLFTEANVAACMHSEIGTINDLAAIKKSMTDFNPEVLIHMAAQPLVRLSYKEPIETYMTNVIGTANVLESARSCSHLK